MPCSHCKLAGHNKRTCPLLKIRRSMAARTIAGRWRTWVLTQHHIDYPHSMPDDVLHFMCHHAARKIQKFWFHWLFHGPGSYDRERNLRLLEMADQADMPCSPESPPVRQSLPPPQEPELCPICCDEIGSDSAKTPCGHLFCTGCLLRNSQENGNCPMCRAEIVPPSDKKFTQSDLLDAESDGIRQGWHDSEQHYIPALEEQRLVLLQEIDRLKSLISTQEEHDALLKAHAHIANQFYELREKFDIETQKSYDEGLRDGRRLQMETQKMIATKNSL